MSDAKRTLLLIDLSGIFYANWHSSADLNVGEAFRKTLAKVAQLRQGYDLVAVAVDSPPYDRKKIFPDYKANRDAVPADLKEQLRRVIERIEADGILVWACPGTEADDIIATASVRAVADGLSVVIASADKDLLQLVGQHDTEQSVKLLNPATGEEWYAGNVFNKFGVTPDNLADSLALTGDKSDNVPGVPGIGPKKAAALINAHGDLAHILAAAEGMEVSAVRDALIKHADDAGISKKLVTLRYDVPIDFAQIYETREAKPISDIEDAAPVDDPKTDATRGAETALTVITPQTVEWSLQLEPSNAEMAYKNAKVYQNSRMYSKFGSWEAIYAIVAHGRALGLPAPLALNCFHVVESRPTMHADLIVALVRRSGQAEYFDLVETTDERATYVTKRKGSTREVSMTFTIEDACRAELVTRGEKGYFGISRSGKASNWMKYRAVMLRHRCKTQLARAVYEDIVLGLFTPDEVSNGEYIEAEE